MNPILSAFGAAAKAASTAYYCYADNFGVSNREADTRSVEVAANQSADVGIPVFHGSGYEIWSSMMRSLFLSQDLWDMMEGGYIEEEMSVEVLREVRKKDARALLFIQQTIGASVFSCIAGAKKSKEAWDALQNKFQGDDNPVDKSVLSCPADATQCKEAWDALEMESQGNAQELYQKKAVDESVLSCTADATGPKELGYKANTKVVETNRIVKGFGDFKNCGFKEWCSVNSSSDDRRFKMNHSDNSTPAAESAFHSKLKLSEDGIGEESGDIKNNNCGSKKGFRGISNCGGRGGRNGGLFNNNQGGRGGQDVECSYNQGSHGSTDSGHFNNSRGGRRGRGRGHFSNNRGGNGVKDHGHSYNNLGGGGGINRECFNNNQGGHGGIESEHFKNNQGGCGGLDDGCFNSKKSHSGGIDGGHFNRGSEAADYNKMNAKFKSNEASNANALPEGHQAFTELHAQPQVGNLNGGVNQSLTTLFVSDIDVNVTDSQLCLLFSRFGQVVSASVCRDMSSQCSLGYGYVTYSNPQEADDGLKMLNFAPLYGKPVRIVMYPQQEPTENKSLDRVIDDNLGGRGGQDHGGIDSGHNQGGRVGIDGGCFKNKYSEFSDYNSKNPNFESVASISTNATKSKQASDAPQQGHQANTEVNAKFSAFGNLVSCKVARDASGQTKGKGYMEYDSEETAQKAIRNVNGRLLNNKKVYVGPVVSKQEGEKVTEMTKFTNVYVGNLSESTTEEDLRKVFDIFGTIVRILVMRDGDGKSKGFGFVNFKNADDAAWCMQVMLNGHKVDNKVWCVRRATHN